MSLGGWQGGIRRLMSYNFMLTFKLDFNRQMQKYKDSQQKMTMISHLLKDAFSSMFFLSMTSVNFAMREELGE
jgi:hypothetical protein